MTNDEKVLAEMMLLEKGWWCGLEELADATQLKKQGLIYSEPIYNEATLKLNGRGWFVKA